MIFTNNCHIILIKFVNGCRDRAIADLKAAKQFLSEIGNVKQSTMNSAVHPFIHSLGHDQGHQDDSRFGIPIFSNIDNLCKEIQEITGKSSEMPEQQFNLILKTMAFLRTLKTEMYTWKPRYIINKINSNDEAIKQETMELARAIKRSHIEENPLFLLDSSIALELTMNRLYNLTPQQYEFLQSDEKTVLLLGAAGTGKTLVTKFKLLKHLRMFPEERTAVFVAQNMLEEYKKFVEKNMECSIATHPIFYSLSNSNIFLETLMRELHEGSHIFIEDSQYFYRFQQIFCSSDVLHALTIWRATHKEKQLWIVLD